MKLFNKLIEWLYVSKLRILLRKLGLIRIIGSVLGFKTLYFKSIYTLRKPEEINVEILNYKIKMPVQDENEYIRVISYKQDIHILKFLLERIKLGDICWDIGANIGLYTLLMAKAAGSNGKIFAFEPEKLAYERLLQNVKFNNLSNINTFSFALGSENKDVLLEVSNHYASGAHSLVHDQKNPRQEKNYEAVKLLKGDDFIKDKKFSIPNIIKIDVEGAEYEVLLGLQETLKDKNCTVIICEIHFSILNSIERDPKTILAILRNCGFNDLIWLDHSHLAASKEVRKNI